jgi:hypothetical protein
MELRSDMMESEEDVPVLELLEELALEKVGAAHLPTTVDQVRTDAPSTIDRVLTGALLFLVRKTTTSLLFSILQTWMMSSLKLPRIETGK